MKNLQEDNSNLLIELSELIQQGKNKVAIQVNSTLTLVFWQVGNKINDFIFGGERAEQFPDFEIVTTLSSQLSWSNVSRII